MTAPLEPNTTVEDAPPVADDALRQARPAESIDGWRALDGIRARLFGRPRSHVNVGRYVLGERIGAGGLGVVHAAHDPQLDREVAIKLLRRSEGDSSREEARLLREGQAIARLSHSNVIEVFDVGTYDCPHLPEDPTGMPRQGVFVVMPRLTGQTLEAWLNQEARPWPEVLEVMRAAGRGLLAAHDAGLVHRDFKPTNVFVEDDGRVRVLDFGLARPHGHGLASTTAPLLPLVGESVDAMDAMDAITRTGTVLGTPAYMAPEQHEGRSADARSDQYSFCATLYRGLYGVRPFEGHDLDELAEAKRAQALAPPQRDPRLPRWLRTAILRGLSPAARERWPSMHALLQALSPGHRHRGRRMLALGGGVLGLATVGLWHAPQAHCDDTTAWTPQARVAVHEALSAHEPGRRALERVSAGLDAYAEDWTDRRHSICLATATTQEDPNLDLRMSCLRQRRAHLDALVEVLASADADVAAQASSAVARLPRLASCDDTETLRAELGPPIDPAVARDAEAIRASISEVSALLTAGQIDEALTRAEPLPARAEALDLPALRAEALWWSGHLRRISGDIDGSTPLFEQASMLAATHGHDKIAALAGVELATLLGQQARYDEALEWTRHAEAAALRYGPNRYPEARAYASRGVIVRMMGRGEEAYALFERAMEVQERADPLSHELPTILNNLGNAALTLGRYPEAHRHYEQSHARIATLLGNDHPQTAQALMNLAITTGRIGRHEDARAQYLEAREQLVRHFGPGDLRVAYVDTNLADMLLDMGELEEGSARFAAARDLFAETLGPTHPNTAMARSGWGMAQIQLGHPTKARPAMEQALTDAREAFGPEHLQVGVAMGYLGQVDLEEGDLPTAIKRLVDAEQMLERLDAEPGLRLRPRFQRARAQWRAGEHEPARALALEVADGLAEVVGQEPAKAEVEAWLVAHPLP